MAEKMNKMSEAQKRRLSLAWESLNKVIYAYDRGSSTNIEDIRDEILNELHFASRLIRSVFPEKDAQQRFGY